MAISGNNHKQMNQPQSNRLIRQSCHMATNVNTAQIVSNFLLLPPKGI
jgi:hypothetical protein